MLRHNGAVVSTIAPDVWKQQDVVAYLATLGATPQLRRQVVGLQPTGPDPEPTALNPEESLLGSGVTDLAGNVA